MPRSLLLVLLLASALPVLKAAEEPLPWTSYADGKVKLSVDYRLRYEYWENAWGNKLTRDADEELEYGRLYLGLQVKPIESVTAKIQLRDSRAYHAPSSFYDDEDQTNKFNNDDPLDISELYLRLDHPGDIDLDATVGRQYWVIGDQRLIGGLKWTNNARNFDSIKATTGVLGAPLGIYFGRHVNQFNQEHVNDAWDSAYDYVSALTLQPSLGESNARLLIYSIYADHKTTGVADTVTTGYLCKLDPDGPFSLSNEVAFQVGDHHRAYAASLRGTLSGDKSSIALELNYGSGDSNPDDGDSRTFDNLYPTNHMHYGVMDLGSWRNAMSAGLLGEVKPCERLTTGLRVWALGLAEAEDNWYAASGAPVGSAAKRDNGSQFLGTEVDFVNTIKLCRFATLELAAAYFFAGDAADGRSGGTDAAFIYSELNLHF